MLTKTESGPRRITQETSFEAPITELISAKEFVGKFKPADQTPSVLNLKSFKAGNTVANNITYFDDGQDGQSIAILGDGFTTLVHDATKIKTETGANKLLSLGKVYRFTRFDSVWVEESALAGAAVGASVTCLHGWTNRTITPITITEQSFGTYTIPGNTLVANGNSLRVRIFGEVTSSGGISTTLRLKFGGVYLTGVLNYTGATPAVFMFDTMIMRRALNTQESQSILNINNALFYTYTALALTEANPLALDLMVSRASGSGGTASVRVGTVELLAPPSVLV